MGSGVGVLRAKFWVGVVVVFARIVLREVECWQGWGSVAGTNVDANGSSDGEYTFACNYYQYGK